MHVQIKFYYRAPHKDTTDALHRKDVYVRPFTDRASAERWVDVFVCEAFASGANKTEELVVDDEYGYGIPFDSDKNPEQILTKVRELISPYQIL